VPNVRYESETERILKRSKTAFEELLLQSQIRENGEVKKENSAEFEKLFKERENIVMSSLKTLIRNPACISHDPYLKIFKEIYKHDKELPDLYHKIELWLITFINPKFEEYFKFRINKTSFYKIFPSEALFVALDNFKYSDF